MNLDSSENSRIEKLIRAEKLPANFMATVDNIYRPLAADLALRTESCATPLIVGINGAQGTGKSTLTQFLVELLDNQHGLKTAFFSIDDIYLTKQQRQDLAENVHPMLATRGVPGTHDIDLGKALINGLVHAGPGDITPIPVFDKAKDDRAPEDRWRRFQGKPSVIIIEGWCAGALPEEPAALNEPLNDLERLEDPDGVWRRYVNHQLETSYRNFFSLFDVLVFIAVPEWTLVYQWRLLQEQKLKDKCNEQGLDISAVMSPEQVARFVQFYERVTRHTLTEMPSRADYVLTMEADHRISTLSGV